MAVSLTVYEIFSSVTLKTGLGVVQGHLMLFWFYKRKTVGRLYNDFDRSTIIWPWPCPIMLHRSFTRIDYKASAYNATPLTDNEIARLDVQKVSVHPA